MHHADSKVNPRKAKINPIVKAIEETLQFSPELYFFSSKGILLSSIYVDLLDRNRVRLSFSEEEMEGIMDGGHNAFALCRFIANVINDDNLITWDDCIRYYRNEDTFASLKVGYESHIGQLKFSIPIEVIAPVDKDEASIEYFSNHILEILSLIHISAHRTTLIISFILIIGRIGNRTEKRHVGKNRASGRIDYAT